MPHWLRPRNSPSLPNLDSYTRALLVNQDRRHLFVTPCIKHLLPFYPPTTCQFHSSHMELCKRVLLHNGGSCNACTMKRCIHFSVLLNRPRCLMLPPHKLLYSYKHSAQNDIDELSQNKKKAEKCMPKLKRLGISVVEGCL